MPRAKHPRPIGRTDHMERVRAVEDALAEALREAAARPDVDRDVRKWVNDLLKGDAAERAAGGKK